ncbi:hypothetical protein GCM10011495_01600 [Hymenobacter frigidus]|uniref:GSCFA domain-containing protein n=2 Tax=Hymenobacter frigidus TaxID=1524095 RepID=A0ABQ1ZTA2_9BACT|nr:hypothetical protein GCM10011495_01600 [Hymenobacter frigidus]
MGSCFADSMGVRLNSYKVDALVNPFGTVFQPLALGRLLRAAAGEDVDWQQHLVQARGRWQSYDLHGSIGADSPVDLLQIIQALVQRTGEFLRGADAIALTLGTAWAYRLRETGELVNNCHKQSADLFVRELLTPDDIINGLAETHAYLRRINPELRFILTVSPVRHLKDTLPLNTVSKSVLRIATHILSDLLPGVEYFPAYELLTDDLRDYRFYADDMLHPSAVAEDYIWDKFARTYFDADFGRFRKEWTAVRQSLGHRPLHSGAPEHREFLESTREKLEQLSLRKVDVATELQQVRAQLAALPVPQQPEPALEIEDDEERIDIGEGAAAKATELTAPRIAEARPSENRPPRLSPEEFRAQRAARPDRPERGRRDGRGKGQVPQPSENEQFQTTAFETESPLTLSTSPVETPQAAAMLATGVAEEAATLPGQEAGTKKKRRSRGGAKRTARKNALLLAAEMGTDAAQDDDSVTNSDIPADFTAAASVGQNTRREDQKTSVITKSQPVKRGGRREDSGRVPRVGLFAAPAPAPADFATTETPITDAESPVLIPSMIPTELPQEGENALATQPDAITGPSRNSRNRNKRKAANALANSVQETVARAASDTGLVSALPIVDAEQLSSAAEPMARPENRRDNRRQPQRPIAALPETAPGTTAIAAIGAVLAPEVPNPPTAAKRSSRKSRAVSGGRAEKPAFDTPVIPVQDASIARLQVAAGRMTGSSATLVEPVAMPKPVSVKAAIAKPIASKAKLAKAPVVPNMPVVAASVVAAPVVAAPVAAAPVVAAPVAAAPVAAAPVAAAPVAAAPVVAAPVAAAPVVAAPVVAAPVAAAPVVAAPVAAAPVAAAPKAKAPATKVKAPVSAKPTKPAPKATVAAAQIIKPVAAVKPAAKKPAIATKSSKTAAAKPVAPEAAKPSTKGKPAAKAVPKPTTVKPAAVKPAPAKSVESKPAPTTKATAKPAAVKPKTPKKPTK